MLILQGVTYTHPNRDLLFADIDLTINKQDKIALIGNNGIGKSTLLQIMAGDLAPSNGTVRTNSKPYYVPQIFGQFNDYTVAQALRIDGKLKALQAILDGKVSDANLVMLDDDWTIEERCREAFASWGLEGLQLEQKMESLSGGQKTKVFLAGINIHRPEIILLDEPSNHLDAAGRNILYDHIRSTKHTLVVVSHDKTLLRLLPAVYEFSKRGIVVYGGNYDFYTEQKMIGSNALDQDVRSQEKALRKAKEIERESMERQQKLDARGKKKQEKSGLPTISMNTFRNNAEKSTSRMKDTHAEKVDDIAHQLEQLRKDLPGVDKMKMGLDHSSLHQGKILITLKAANFGYDDHLLWKRGLDMKITSGERIAIKGPNGSGKTTLIKMILGELRPRTGDIDRADVKAVYIDQDYSLIDDRRSVYEQAQEFNTGVLQEHEIKIRLSRFLFTKDDWDKPCKALSGGEKMRLSLCCLTISTLSPDIILLDEPTNNLDIQNIEILIGAINEYRGTLLVVSHDEYFVNQVKVERVVHLDRSS